MNRGGVFVSQLHRCQPVRVFTFSRQVSEGEREAAGYFSSPDTRAQLPALERGCSDAKIKIQDWKRVGNKGVDMSSKLRIIKKHSTTYEQ